ncbi:conserved hypothetical protein [Tenacibaculum dicentrarchi]|nr:conserved hypothetical protein [Tenacibaculum dicentrarchi]
MDSNIIGVKGEEFVNEIAYKSFFKYWCYPSPKHENGNKKEICDLLIIFKDICIIISVKNYEFKGNHLRYFNNTIEKAVKQINGASKTLFKKDNIEIKHPDKNLEMFPKDKISKTFKLIINLGESLDFYEITRTTSKNDFISIFNKESFVTIISELDTIPDFIDYLEKRELLFKSKNVKVLNPIFKQDLNDKDKQFLTKDLQNSINIIGTEKDLLSYFFKNTRDFPKELYDNNGSMLLDICGAWEEFKISPKTIKKEYADKASYFVDGFILNEVLKYDYSNKEDIAKELLSLNRLQRRTIGNNFFEFYGKVKGYKQGMLHRRFMEYDDLAVVLFNFHDNWNKEMIYKLFEIVFETFAYHYKYKHRTFILIGINKVPNFAFKIFKDYEKFSLEDEKTIQENIKELGWFTDYNLKNSTVNEFPK